MLLGKFGPSARRAALAVVLLGALGVFIAASTAARASASSSRSNAAGLAQLYAASSHGLDVIPNPGTPDAPAGTPIDFPAVAPAQIVSVQAVGSSTGLHRGRLSAQPDNAGTQFAPDHPFAAGESVSVTAKLRSTAAGAASGAPGSDQLRFSFTIARPASGFAQAGAFAPNAAPPPTDSLGMTPQTMALNHASASTTHSYVTEPNFHPPIIDMVGHNPDTTAGNIFLTAQNTGQNAPYMLDRASDLVWYHPTASKAPGPSAFDFRVQNYQGQPYLTYWEGHVMIPPGIGNGVGAILNQHYQRVHTVTAGAGYQHNGLDLHEFSIGANGDAFATIYAFVHANLKSVGGPSDGVVLDSIAQEINIATNRVVWEWDALKHVPLNASYIKYTPGYAFDFFHMNSIQELGNGHVIISGRHTMAVYSVNKATGNIDWVLNGRHPTFFMGTGSHFFWQHDAELHNNGNLTVFDNGSNGGTNNESQSRALEIHINFGNKQATLLHQYLHSPPVLATSMGETQVLFNHNVFVGWGKAPSYSEFSPSGTQLYKAWFHSPVCSYRGYRFASFSGQPLQAPAVAVRSAPAGKVKVYVSWNGSTLVRQWRLMAGSSPKSLHQVAMKNWVSFETTIVVSKWNYFQVQALSGKGHALAHGTSPTVHG